MQEKIVYSDKSVNSEFWVEYYLFPKYLLLISKIGDLLIPLEQIVSVLHITIDNAIGLRIMLKEFILETKEYAWELSQPYISFNPYSHKVKYVDITPENTVIFSDKLDVQMDNIYWEN